MISEFFQVSEVLGFHPKGGGGEEEDSLFKPFFLNPPFLGMCRSIR